jgi:hypothetical protein
MTIAIIEYGMGNVRSLMNAFEYIGEDAYRHRRFRPCWKRPTGWSCRASAPSATP